MWEWREMSTTRFAEMWEAGLERETVHLGMMQYSVYAVLSVCGTWCMQYSMYAVLGVCSTWCMLYLVYTALSVCSTQCMQHSVYAVLGVCCTRCMLYSVYAGLGFNLWTMAWSDSEERLDFVFWSDSRVEDETERDERRWKLIMSTWELENYMCKSIYHSR